MSDEQVSKKAPVKAMWIVMILAWVFFLLPLPGTGIFIAGPLNLAAFILAIVCLVRSKVAQGVLGLIGTLVISGILYFVGTAATIGTALQSMDTQSQQSVKTAARQVLETAAKQATPATATVAGAAKPQDNAPAALPNFDTTAYCKKISGAAGGSYQIQSACVDGEKEAKSALTKITVPGQVMQYCTGIGNTAGGSYQILQACIEQELDAKNKLKQ